MANIYVLTVGPAVGEHMGTRCIEYSTIRRFVDTMVFIDILAGTADNAAGSFPKESNRYV